MLDNNYNYTAYSFREVGLHMETESVGYTCV